MQEPIQTKRTFFYDRTETASQTIYRFKRQWWKFYVAGFGAAVVFAMQLHFISPYIALGCAFVALSYIVFGVISHIKPNLELRAAAKRGAVRGHEGFVFTIEKKDGSN
jgi:hypothetical protein